jgi:hypothetical protein
LALSRNVSKAAGTTAFAEVLEVFEVFEILNVRVEHLEDWSEFCREVAEITKFAAP